MFEKLKENAKEYIKSIANQVFDERIPEEPYIETQTLPEIDKNAYLACSIQKTHADLIPDLPAGVAMDAAYDTTKLNNAYNITNPVNDIIYTHFAVQGFIGFQACSVLCQNWLINKACSQPAKDAIRPDYDLSYVSADEEEKDDDFITKIIDESNDRKGFNIKSVCSVFEQKKRAFGQVVAFPKIDGVDYSLPFSMDAIEAGANTYRGMTVVDPVWYTPILDDEAVSDPTSLRYMKPTYFQMPDGKKIHHSWCIFGVNGDVSDVLLPTYRFGGYPIPQLIYERVYCAEKTANEAHMLAQSKRLLIADINVKSYMTNPQNTVNELNALTQFRDNWGVMTKRPGDSVQQIDTSLTDLDEVIMTQYQLVAAAACVPATKLLETQPKGFNSTGDYEDDQYKLTLVEIQKADYIPLLDFHFALLSKSRYGIERDYTITFKEIDTPTELERAQINQTNAATAATYVQAGVISPDEVRDNLIKDPNSGFNDITGELEDDEDFSLTDEPDGGSSNEQNPFSMDEDWKESEHPRDKGGKFTSGGSSTGGVANVKSNPYKNKKIAGQKCGTPMIFEKANGGRVNPTFSPNNCHSCVAVFEARMRGFNIETLPYNSKTKDIMDKLAKRPYMVYNDPVTGQPPKLLNTNAHDKAEVKKWLQDNIKNNERYAFMYKPINQADGHMIEVMKNADGQLVYYDPQLGTELNEKELEDIDYSKMKPWAFRVDDKELNTTLLNQISKKSNGKS